MEAQDLRFSKMHLTHHRQLLFIAASIALAQLARLHALAWGVPILLACLVWAVIGQKKLARRPYIRITQDSIQAYPDYWLAYRPVQLADVEAMEIRHNEGLFYRPKGQKRFKRLAYRRLTHEEDWEKLVHWVRTLPQTAFGITVTEA